MPTLSVTMTCWNCDNAAPTHHNGTFKYIAIERDLDGRIHDGEKITGEIHQICADCFCGGTRIMEVPVFVQDIAGEISV